MIENFTQNNHGVSTINQVTSGYINAAKSDDSGTELCTEQCAEPSIEQHKAYIMAHYDPLTRSMLQDFPQMNYKKQLKVLVFTEDVNLEP